MNSHYGKPSLRPVSAVNKLGKIKKYSKIYIKIINLFLI